MGSCFFAVFGGCATENVIYNWHFILSVVWVFLCSKNYDWSLLVKLCERVTLLFRTDVAVELYVIGQPLVYTVVLDVAIITITIFWNFQGPSTRTSNILAMCGNKVSLNVHNSGVSQAYLLSWATISVMSLSGCAPDRKVARNQFLECGQLFTISGSLELQAYREELLSD